MVDARSEQLNLESSADTEGPWNPPAATTKRAPLPQHAQRRHRRFTALLLGVIVAAAGALALGSPGPATSARASLPPSGVGAATHHTEGSDPVTAPVPAPTMTTAAPTVNAPVPAPAPPETPPVTQPAVSTLIGEVVAAGVDPGTNWSWSMGDTATRCGTIVGGELATGCTFWTSGVEKTVFAGAPSLALVAHELANAETEDDAVPSLLSRVATAAAGTSWSATDAVASCLVEHFLGFQDHAAGTWQCPAALATFVADNIHEAVATTETTAICGMTSGVSSTLTFTGSAGTLTVTAPATGTATQTVPAGTPVTVSGIGTFTAVDRGGTVGETGPCEA